MLFEPVRRGLPLTELGPRAQAALVVGDREVLAAELLEVAEAGGRGLALGMLAELAARDQGAGLLAPYAARISRLPDDPLKDALLALAAVRVGGPGEAVREALLALLERHPLRAASVAAGLAWALADAGQSEEAGRLAELAVRAQDRSAGGAQRLPAEAEPAAEGTGSTPGEQRRAAASWAEEVRLEAAAAAVLVEWNTHAGTAAFDAVQATLAGPRSGNRLASRHALPLLAVSRVLAGRHDLGAAAVNLARAVQLLPAAAVEARLTARAELAFVRYRQGDWRGARQEAQLVSDAAGGVPVAGIRGLGLAVEALEPALSGRVARARERIEEARRALLDQRSLLGEIVLLHARIALAIGMNRWDELLLLLEEAEEPGYRRSYTRHEWQALWAIALRNSGALDRYRAHLRRWAREPGAEDTPYLWAHRGLLAQHDGDGPAALGHALEAQARLSRDDDPLGRGWTRIVVGTLVSLFGDPARGMESYETARHEFEEIGADGFARLCVRILQATAAEVAARTRDPLAPLTQQQRRVAELVAEGFTSAEIAQILYLSKRTVDFHVGNIVARLQLRNRREIKRMVAAAEGA